MNRRMLILLCYANIILSVTIVLAHGIQYPASIWLSACASLVIIINSVIILFIFQYSKEISQPPLSVLKSKIEVNLVQQDGKRVTYDKLQTIKVNTANVVSYIERGLTADPNGGTIRNFKSFSNVLGSEMTETKYHINSENEYEVFFDSLPKKDQTFERKISCEFIDSFLNDEEWFSVFFTREVKIIDVEIKFPTDRPFKTASLFVLDQYSNYQYDNPPFIYNDEKTLLQFKMEKPKTGTRFKIVWTW